jgi:hypothetical protein
MASDHEEEFHLETHERHEKKKRKRRVKTEKR